MQFYKQKSAIFSSTFKQQAHSWCPSSYKPSFLSPQQTGWLQDMVRWVWGALWCYCQGGGEKASSSDTWAISQIEWYAFCEAPMLCLCHLGFYFCFSSCGYCSTQCMQPFQRSFLFFAHRLWLWVSQVPLEAMSVVSKMDGKICEDYLISLNESRSLDSYSCKHVLGKA